MNGWLAHCNAGCGYVCCGHANGCCVRAAFCIVLSSMTELQAATTSTFVSCGAGVQLRKPVQTMAAPLVCIEGVGGWTVYALGVATVDTVSTYLACCGSHAMVRGSCPAGRTLTCRSTYSPSVPFKPHKYKHIIFLALHFSTHACHCTKLCPSPAHPACWDLCQMCCCTKTANTAPRCTLHVPTTYSSKTRITPGNHRLTDSFTTLPWVVATCRQLTASSILALCNRQGRCSSHCIFLLHCIFLDIATLHNTAHHISQ